MFSVVTRTVTHQCFGCCLDSIQGHLSNPTGACKGTSQPKRLGEDTAGIPDPKINPLCFFLESRVYPVPKRKRTWFYAIWKQNICRWICWAAGELPFFKVAGKELWFGFVLETAQHQQGCFGYCWGRRNRDFLPRDTLPKFQVGGQFNLLQCSWAI